MFGVKTKTAAAPKENVFFTQEMMEILDEIDRTRHQQKALDADVEAACKRMIDKKFDNKLLDELESLEKQEVDLENKHMRLCRDYLTLKQKVLLHAPPPRCVRLITNGVSCVPRKGAS